VAITRKKVELSKFGEYVRDNALRTAMHAIKLEDRHRFKPGTFEETGGRYVITLPTKDKGVVLTASMMMPKKGSSPSRLIGNDLGKILIKEIQTYLRKQERLTTPRSKKMPRKKKAKFKPKFKPVVVCDICGPEDERFPPWEGECNHDY